MKMEQRHTRNESIDQAASSVGQKTWLYLVTCVNLLTGLAQALAVIWETL